MWATPAIHEAVWPAAPLSSAPKKRRLNCCGYEGIARDELASTGRRGATTAALEPRRSVAGTDWTPPVGNAAIDLSAEKTPAEETAPARRRFVRERVPQAMRRPAWQQPGRFGGLQEARLARRKRRRRRRSLRTGRLRHPLNELLIGSAFPLAENRSGGGSVRPFYDSQQAAGGRLVVIDHRQRSSDSAG